MISPDFPSNEPHPVKGDTATSGLDVQSVTPEAIVKACPWLGFSGEPGSLEYALQVLDMLTEPSDEEPKYCIVHQGDQWWVEPFTRIDTEEP